MAEGNAPIPGVTEGRIVHYVMPNGDHRAAMIVNAWKNAYGGRVNLNVFVDGENDNASAGYHSHPVTGHDAHGMSVFGTTSVVTLNGVALWETSVPFDNDEKKPRTWHWIEQA